MVKSDKKFEIITENLPSWERALVLFENMTGLTVSLYLASGERVIGPLSMSPLGMHLKELGAFKIGGVAQRSEKDELIPILALKETRIKLFADTLTILGIPIKVDKEVIGVIYAGWVFDHFADPIECERLSRLFGSSGMDLWQIARMQAPVSPEKLRIFQEMLELMVSTMSEQMFTLREFRNASRIKDELLALVSHELKTPLTSLLIRVQMLKTHKIAEEKMPEFIRSMESSTQLQSKLVDDLLDAAQIVTGKFSINREMVDLKKIIEESMDMLSFQCLEKNIKLQFSEVGGDYRYNGDGLRLKQVVINLLGNALKFTPPGGHISVGLTRNISNFLLKISDDGDGIDAGFVQEIFDRFSQERLKINSRAGLGLGLFIVKRIIELHNGSIDVFSAGKNKGTVFEVLLPHS